MSEKTFYFTESVIRKYTIKANTKQEAIEMYESGNVEHDNEEYIEDSTYIYDKNYNQLSYYGEEE